MTPTWPRIRAVFERALEIAPAGRGAFLAAECGSDETLRSEVEALLAAEAESATLFEYTPLHYAIERGLIPPIEPELRPGMQIGRYTLQRVIASGGMGTVFEATQSHPTRIVALKTIRADLLDSNARRRFEYEAEALARLQHPNIAQIFEAGIDGRPIFAMELIAGAKPLCAYEQGLSSSIRERLLRFAAVCDAVHHGHQRGVLHRDLKPSNILVDERGTPKVIDYGVARIAGGDNDRSSRTVAGEVLGTLQYMAPEQLRSDLQAIDVRADVYSLGAVLHELLCGSPLFDLRGKNVVEAIQIVATTEPKPPSVLDPSIPREIDWIVAKAVDRERDRRYRSVSELAADIARYLADEPLEVGPPSGLYRARKFARRHRSALATLAAILIALTTGLWVALREKAAAERARDSAALEATRAQATLAFVTNIFAAVRADTGRRDATMKSVIDEAATRIDSELRGQPLVEAAVRSVIGACYLSIDDVVSAAPHLERAVELRRTLLGDRDVETLRARIALGTLRKGQGRREDAEREYRTALTGLAAAVGESDKDVIVAMSSLGTVLDSLGRMEEAEGLHRRAVAIAGEHLPGSGEQAMVEAACAETLLAAGKKTEAHEMLDRALSHVKGTSLDNHAFRLRIELDLADRSIATEPEEAAKELARIHAESETRLGERSLMTITALETEGRALTASGAFEAARERLQSALEGARRYFGDGAETTSQCRRSLAKVLCRMGRRTEAEPILRAAVEDSARAAGTGDREALEMRLALAAFLIEERRFDEAEPELRTIVETGRSSLGATAPTVTAAANWLSEALNALKKPDEGVAMLKPLVAACRRELGDEHEATIQLIGDLAATYMLSKEYLEAIPLLEAVLSNFTRLAGTGDPGVGAVELDLGVAKRESGDLKGAEDMLRRSLAIQYATLKSGDPSILRVAEELAIALERLGRPDEAKKIRDDATNQN